jgi:hypothetical protein
MRAPFAKITAALDPGLARHRGTASLRRSGAREADRSGMVCLSVGLLGRLVDRLEQPDAGVSGGRGEAAAKLAKDLSPSDTGRAPAQRRRHDPRDWRASRGDRCGLSAAQGDWKHGGAIPGESIKVRVKDDDSARSRDRPRSADVYPCAGRPRSRNLFVVCQPPLRHRPS